MNASSRVILAAVSVALPAALTAWLAPRGPWTFIAAPLSVLFCAAAGYVGGILAGRWAYLGPLVFGLVLELGRLDVVGPTVDLPPSDRLAASTTWLVFLLPRLLHILVSAVPMLLGTRMALTGWGQSPRPWASGGVIAVLAVIVAVPPTTAPVPGGIAEFRTVTVNGRETTMLLRGADRRQPVLLWLSGGPGGTELGMAPEAFARLEKDVVVVTWDQPGAGLSAPALTRHGRSLTDAVDDTIAVTDYLRREFGQDRILLAGNSGGTMVGVLAVHRRPDLFRAYFGSGQMVDVTATDTVMYDETMAWARAHDPSLAARLERFGRPPYATAHALDYLPVLSTPGYDYGPATSVGGTFPGNLARRELGPAGAVGSLLGMLDTFAVTYPTWDGVDLRREVRSLDVPVYLLQGSREHPGRQVLAREWFDALDAPTKEWIDCPDAGHRCMSQDPELWASTIRRAVG